MLLNPIWLAVLLVCGCGTPTPPAPISLSGPTMGTRYNVKISTMPDGIDVDDLQATIDAELAVINARMSTYDPTSELSIFNRHEADDWYEISDETAEVIERALQISERTDGAFDVTIGPAVNLWSFGPQEKGRRVPSEIEIADANEKVGYHQIELRKTPLALRKSQADVYVDLSAIAKGYAVDRIAALLDKLAVGGFMVEIGGEVFARGTKADGDPWRIGIERPVDEARVIELAVALRDRAMATSGDYRNFYIIDGIRYSHAIDPRTGRPVQNGIASVSVIADDCMTADAWATALMVLGPDQAISAAKANGLEVTVMVRDGEAFRMEQTAGFAKVTK